MTSVWTRFRFTLSSVLDTALVAAAVTEEEGLVWARAVSGPAADSVGVAAAGGIFLGLAGALRDLHKLLLLSLCRWLRLKDMQD